MRNLYRAILAIAVLYVLATLASCQNMCDADRDDMPRHRTTAIDTLR